MTERLPVRLDSDSAMVAAAKPRVATALLIAYDGSRGWAWDPTIKAVVADVFSRIVRSEVQIEAASRTDAGVHARGQIACVFAERSPPGDNYGKLAYRMNQLLPEDVVIRAAGPVPPTFDVRANAGKTYSYTLLTSQVRDPLGRRREWHRPPRHDGPAFDIVRARAAAEALVGTHDFVAFANSGANQRPSSVCTIKRLELCNQGRGRVRFEIDGNRFVYRMVRNMIGLLARCGAGELEPDIAADVLATRAWPSGTIKLTAPPHGLMLESVHFTDEQAKSLPSRWHREL